MFIILIFWQLNQQFRGNVVGISWWQYFISFQNNAGHNVWCLLLGESVALQGPLAARCLYSQWFGTGNLVQVLMVQKIVWFCCSPVCELDRFVAFTSATQGWNVINIHKLVRIVDSLSYSSKKVPELDKGTIARGSVWLRPPLKKITAGKRLPWKLFLIHVDQKRELLVWEILFRVSYAENGGCLRRVRRQITLQFF
jgi:hypothetical protein